MVRGVAENAILNKLYRGTVSIDDFCWDSMTTVPILCLMSPEDIEYIRRLIMSPRYSGNNKLKMEKIDEVMHRRGFTRFAGGTNRLVYTHPSAPNAVFKVAIDSVGIDDNPAEFRNQRFLKPYCCKVFECSPCGTIASFEKVSRITTFEEFYTIADDYFYLLSRVILGKYVMEDIGINFFMNVGIRLGWGIVLLDFPYLFELDGAKLECMNKLDDESICHGEIDYDHGFNNLICKKCGRVYRARDLAKPPESSGILLKQKGAKRMKLLLKKGDNVIKVYDTTIERDHLSKVDTDVVKTSSANVVLNKIKTEVPEKNTEVVKKHVVTEVKNNVAPTENIKPKNVVVKTISVSVDAKEPVEVIRKTSTNINLVKKEVKVPYIDKNYKKTVAGTAKSVSIIDNTNKNNSVPKEEAQVVERVIDLSVGKRRVSDPINRETTSNLQYNTPKVQISTDIVEELSNVATEKVEAEVVKIEEPIVVEDSIIEAEEVVETPVEASTEEVEIIEEAVVESDDEEETIEEIAEEPITEEVEELEVEETIVELDVIEEIVVESDEEEKTVEEITEEQVEEEPEVEELVVEPDVIEEIVVESDEEETIEESATEEQEDEEAAENEDSSEDIFDYDLKFVTSLPEDKDVKDCTFYCLYNESEIDISAYEGVEDISKISPEIFEIYYLMNDKLSRVIYNFDNNAWEYYYDEDCEEDESDEEEESEEDEAEGESEDIDAEIKASLDKEEEIISDVIARSSGKLSAKDFE